MIRMFLIAVGIVGLAYVCFPVLVYIITHMVVTASMKARKSANKEQGENNGKDD